MNSIKLTDLEIKDGWICKDGVELTCAVYNRDLNLYQTADHNSPMVRSLQKTLRISKDLDCKVKSATIWTEVDKEKHYYKNNNGGIRSFNGLPSINWDSVLQAISQDPKAYATDIVIE